MYRLPLHHLLAALLPWAMVLSVTAQDLGAIGKEKPVRVNGSLSVMGGPYFYSGDGTPRNEPFWWNTTGAVTLSLYG